MKVTFSWAIKTYSGYGDNNVYSRWLRGKLCIMRTYTYPKLTLQNTHIGLVAKNLALVYSSASAGYTGDFEKYRDLRKLSNNSRNPLLMKQIASPLQLFNSMMSAWAKTDPTHIDLTTVTIADIVLEDADVRTVARAVAAGYLKKVYPSADLDKNIDTV